MLTWPREDGDFARHFQQVEQTFVEIALAIARYEPVHINCGLNFETLHERLIAAGIEKSRLNIYHVKSDDVWARDHGPITVFRDGQPIHLDFTFNGWGGKFPCERDNLLVRRLDTCEAWSAPVEDVDFVLEGGGIESDGAGTLLTTERCLLAPTRNPQFDKAGIEAELTRHFGLHRVLWLKHGDLLGDDTDGHIDTLARFCDAGTIAYQACDDDSDPHYADLQAMAAELRAFRRLDGQPYRLVPLPMPSAIHDDDGQRLPAGYANFLIINGAVLVPQYGVPQDGPALDALRARFPDRDAIAIDCRWLIRQYGSLHCVTMQLPA